MILEDGKEVLLPEVIDLGEGSAGGCVYGFFSEEKLSLSDILPILVFFFVSCAGIVDHNPSSGDEGEYEVMGLSDFCEDFSSDEVSVFKFGY